MYQKFRYQIYTFIHKFLSLFAVFFPHKTHKAAISRTTPRVSIITSVFKGDLFIEHFLRDIVQQTIFHECELIIINAHSPGNEEPIIFKYMKLYPNIVYVKLGYDPGLYAVWNRGIALARGDYITNANIDDRVDHRCYELHSAVLDAHPDVDLVYSDIYVTCTPNETVRTTQSTTVQESAEFSRMNMQQCLPNDHPMWRKAMHKNYGFFNETFSSAGDYEMWLRAVAGGAQFKKVPGVLGLHYVHPYGLSTDAHNPKIMAEVSQIRQHYQFLWQQ